MSTQNNSTADGHSSDTHGPGGAAHGSVKEYVLGLLISIILTGIAFYVVMFEGVSPALTLVVILATAVAQVMVQLVFFLHMNTSSEQIWNTTSAAFIIIIVAILIVGSVWIMSHLNHNMMIGH